MYITVSLGAVWLTGGAADKDKEDELARIKQSLAGAEKLVLAGPHPANQPIGQGKGVYPGRVVWAHDPEATDWRGPGDGHPWETNHTSPECVCRMMSRAIQQLAGAGSDAEAWDKLFRCHNKTRGKGDIGYKPGEKIAIKVNFVGFHPLPSTVDPENYHMKTDKDFINVSPQLIIALLRQLVNTVGVKQRDITVGETLAYIASEYYNIFSKEFPDIQYMDYEGKLGRVRAKPSSVPFYWSCRPKDVKQDYVPVCFAEAEYLINFANLKVHSFAGVTLCAKNHFGSLVRIPSQTGYYDMHKNCISKEVKIYRTLVDLMGHAHIGGKTVLYLLDGLYAGHFMHESGMWDPYYKDMDKRPRKWKMSPFHWDWASSLLASQDPAAIDSVGFDFLYAEFEGQPPRNRGVDDYLHEAALANNPPSGTFYDPDHSNNVQRLASLGVHEHWNNPTDKQYSRNLGAGDGIELIAVISGSPHKDIKAAFDLAPGAEKEKENFVVRKAKHPVVIDGDLKEWEGVTPIVIDCTMISSGDKSPFCDNKDCSMLAYLMWNEQNLYLAARIMDDQEVYGRYTKEGRYEDDTVEVWVNKCQLRIGRTKSGNPYPWVWPSYYIHDVPSSPRKETSGDVKAAYKLVKDLGSAKEMEILAGTLGGSVKGGSGRILECAIPHATTGLEGKAGVTFRLAIGVDDEDRVAWAWGQLFWPCGMQGGNPETFQSAILSE